MKTNLVAIYHHPGMQALHEAIGRQDHRTLVLWALETGEEILLIYKTTFPDDPRPGQALDAAASWSLGEIKMPLAKKAARQTHDAAKDAKTAKGKLGLEGSKSDNAQIDAAVAVAHAMGQIIGVVHVATHATAYAAYAVQAAVLLNSDEGPEESLRSAVTHLLERLEYWASADKTNRPWANFL